MNYRRFAFALLVSFPPAIASAASVVMVQFGSFESMAEAQKRLSDVKAAHGADIGTLPLAVREVKLPPDGLTVYRTQAGPAESRLAAQSVCAKLATSGDECYVVETAMSSTPAPNSELAARPAIAPAAAPAPSTPVPTTTVAQPLSASAPRTVAVAPLDTPPTPMAAPSPEMQAALDRAAAIQDAPTGSSHSLSVPQPVDQSSVWSRMNPFSDRTPTTTVVTPHPAVPPSMLKPEFQPAPEVLMAPTSPMLAPMTPAAPAFAAPTPSAPVLGAGAINLNPPVQTAEVLPLLPPPPPLTARDEEFLRANTAMPMPSASMPAAPTSVVVAPPVAVASASLPPANGTVRVEEAKRVPLTESQQSTRVAPPAAAGVSLLPASTLGQKTLWAQLGQFTNPQAALAFWENYRQTHPDFPVVRVRVSASLAQQNHGNDRVWLRVGPFAREGAIRNLCSTLPDTTDLHCGQVTDIGVAGNASPAAGYLNGSRYKR